MRSLAIAALCLLAIASDLNASGFGFGSSTPIDDGIREVNYNFGNGFQFQAAGVSAGLVEVRVTLTNSTVRRTSVLYAGPLAVRTPMSVETVELAGTALFILSLVVVVIPVSRSRSAHRAPRNGDATLPPGNSHLGGRPEC